MIRVVMARLSTPTFSALAVLLALLACKKEESTPQPTATVAPVPVPPPTPAPPPAATSAAPGPESKTGIPTEGTSKPPTVAEWEAVGEITVRHSTPLGCETKLVREWLRVSCRTTSKGPYLIQGVKRTGGKDFGGIPPFVKKDVASIVTQVKKGIDAEYTFDWGNFTRKLVVAWPSGAPAPTIEFDSPPPK